MLVETTQTQNTEPENLPERSLSNESRGPLVLSNNILCHHDNKPCPLLSTIHENADSRLYNKDEVTEVAKGFTPCEHCPRYAACKVPALKEIRLGKLERKALMLAPVDDWLIVETMDDSRAADEAKRRAVLKLVKDGLVYGGFKWVTHEFTQKNSYHVTRHEYKRKAIQITPLGKSVREFYAHELENGKAIRWNRYMDREYDFTESDGELLSRLGRTCKESARYYESERKMLYISKLIEELKAGN